MRYTLSALIFVLTLFIASCASQAPPTQENVQIANPASVYCTDNGGTLEIRTAEDGSQSGICMFADGTECDEWKYFRHECDQGAGDLPPPPPSMG